MPLKLAIFASGSGTNAQAILEKIRRGVLDVSPELVFSDRPGAKVIERAREADIAAIELDPREYESREEFDLKALEFVREYKCEAIALAGYMRILSAKFLEEFGKPVLNVHPALLPSFKGARGAADAVDYGVKISGCSVHFVSEKLDSGPLIIQAAVPTLQNDDASSLHERIQTLEHRVYPQALQWLARGRLRVEGRKTILKPAPNPLAPTPVNALVWPPLEEGF